MKTCGTCEHWGGHNPRKYEEQFRHHRCHRVEHDCNRDATADSWLPGDPEEDREAAKRRASVEDSAVVQDGSGYYAALKTREDFGCVYHKEKA